MTTSNSLRTSNILDTRFDILKDVILCEKQVLNFMYWGIKLNPLSQRSVKVPC
jgi:hypothetical protein